MPRRRSFPALRLVEWSRRRLSPARPLPVGRILIGLLLSALVLASSAIAQGTIGFAQKEGDNERKFIAGLERDDLVPRGLLVLRIDGKSVEVTDHRFDGTQQLALAALDFGSAELGAEALRPLDERDSYGGRRFLGELPAVDEVKRLRLRFEVLDRDEGFERKEKLLCKLETRLPPAQGAVEIYVVAGSTRDFWCRDVAVETP